MSSLRSFVRLTNKSNEKKRKTITPSCALPGRLGFPCRSRFYRNAFWNGNEGRRPPFLRLATGRSHRAACRNHLHGELGIISDGAWSPGKNPGSLRRIDHQRCRGEMFSSLPEFL